MSETDDVQIASPYPSPEQVVAAVLMGRTLRPTGAGYWEADRATRAQAQQVTNALRAAGWRILRS